MIYRFFNFGIMAYICVNLCSCGTVSSDIRSIPVRVNHADWSVHKEFNYSILSPFYFGVYDYNFYYIYGHGSRFTVYVNNKIRRKKYEHIIGIPVFRYGAPKFYDYEICKQDNFSLDIYVEEISEKIKIKAREIHIIDNDKNNFFSKGICTPLSIPIEKCCSCLNSGCQAADCDDLVADDVVLEEGNCYSIKFDIPNISPTKKFTVVLPLAFDTGCDQVHPCESSLSIDFAPNQ